MSLIPAGRERTRRPGQRLVAVHDASGMECEAQARGSARAGAHRAGWMVTRVRSCEQMGPSILGRIAVDAGPSLVRTGEWNQQRQAGPESLKDAVVQGLSETLKRTTLVSF